MVFRNLKHTFKGLKMVFRNLKHIFKGLKAVFRNLKGSVRKQMARARTDIET